MTTRKVKVQEVLGYLSVESATCGYLGTGTVGDFLFGTLKTHGDVPFEKTLEALRTEGQQYPIHVGLAKDLAGEYGIDPLGSEDKLVLGNGHNRVEAAFNLGWKWIEATDRKEESGLTAGINIARELERAEDLALVA
jgi:hypothetical protein